MIRCRRGESPPAPVERGPLRLRWAVLGGLAGLVAVRLVSPDDLVVVVLVVVGLVVAARTRLAGLVRALAVAVAAIAVAVAVLPGVAVVIAVAFWVVLVGVIAASIVPAMSGPARAVSRRVTAMLRRPPATRTCRAGQTGTRPARAVDGQQRAAVVAGAAGLSGWALTVMASDVTSVGAERDGEA